MTRVRLGAVGYLNTRPLVYGLERSPRFDLRFDVPSKCAELLHSDRIDLATIPSIEYLRPAGAAGSSYRIAPDLAIASRGAVASVALYSTRPIGDVRSVALDTSSKTSVALVRILCGRLFRIDPRFEEQPPDLGVMLAQCDAALMIGDNALFSEHHNLRGPGNSTVEKIDLGDAWTTLTGLPFVWAFWAGREGRLSQRDIDALQHARDEGVQHPDVIAREYFSDQPDRQTAGTRYLQDNIKYYFGSDERAGLERFYQYAYEAGLVASAGPLQFY
jgi:chorismate dehydratase